MMKMMLDKGYVAPGSLTHEESDVENDLLSGKIAMSTNWEGSVADARDPSKTVKAVRGQIRIALIPGSKGHRSGSCLGPEGFAIMKSSKNQTEAKAFLNWISQAKQQKESMLRFAQPPIYKAQYNDPTLRALVKKTDGLDDFPTYGQQFNYAQARPNFSGYLDASHRLQVQLHKVFLGDASSAKALKAAADEMRNATHSGNNP
jgi:ABC-type glycerol-3-phosphate transport system substrate-binding protein